MSIRISISVLLSYLLILTAGCGKNQGSAQKENNGISSSFIEVNTLNERTYFKNGWKYIFDDNKAFSDVDFDDSNWPVTNFPQASFVFDKTKSQYCWFRFTFTVSKDLENQSIGLFTGKLPDACEVYFNGSLIGGSGSMQPGKLFSAPNTPRSFILPSKLINIGGKNVLSYKIYMMRRVGVFADVFTTDDNDRVQTYFTDFFLNSVVSMIASILSVFVCIYFILLYVREQQNRFNLFISIGFPLMAIYFSTIYIEVLPMPYLLMMKCQFISLYLGLCFFVFYFQGFYHIHDNKIFKIVLLTLNLIAAIVLFFTKTIQDFEFRNGTVFYLSLITPMLIYILVITIIAIRKRNKYAIYFLIGIILVILAGIRDMAFAMNNYQPRFWMTSWGMSAFILSIFLTSANWSVDNHIESDEKSKKLENQTGILKNIFQNIKDIGERVSETGRLLDISISDATATVQQMVNSNRIILDNMGNQVNTVEKNSEIIGRIVNSFNGIVEEVDRQSKFVDESSKVITDIVTSISSVYQITEEAKKISDTLSTEAEGGKDLVQQSSIAIHAIEDSSNSVKDIVAGIKEIAEQTNILAMNAAIQSAHAGEYGKGFAVVANEVRNLSENSAGRAAEINDQIDHMVDKISSGVKLFDRVKEKLENILIGTKETAHLIGDITGASQKQYNGTSKILSSIDSLVKATENLKNQTQRQREESEKIKLSLQELKSVAANIESSTRDQNTGGNEIASMIEKIRHISGDNQEILQKLDGLIKISEKNMA